MYKVRYLTKKAKYFIENIKKIKIWKNLFFACWNLWEDYDINKSLKVFTKKKKEKELRDLKKSYNIFLFSYTYTNN